MSNVLGWTMPPEMECKNLNHPWIIFLFRDRIHKCEVKLRAFCECGQCTVLYACSC